jgi:hypothetical protein
MFPDGFMGWNQGHHSGLLAVALAISLELLCWGCSSSGGPPQLVHPPGPQKAYSTSFPLAENPISESGNWINGDAAGLDWSNVETTAALAFGTESGSAGYDDSTAILVGLWNPDQMVQATVHTVNQRTDPVFEEVELRLRTTIAPHSVTGYEINFRCTSDGSQYVQIVRWNGSFGRFAYVSRTTGPGLHNGDIVKATISGRMITVFINGTKILEGWDATYKSGSPGIGFFQQGAAGVNSDFGFTSVAAADMKSAN